MGRKKLPKGEKMSERLHIKMTLPYLKWVHRLTETTGDSDTSAMIERVLAREAKRVKFEPPPPR